MLKSNAHVLALTRKQAMKNPELLNTNLKDLYLQLVPNKQLKEQKIAPPATSPLNVLVIKEQKKFKGEK